MHSPGLLLLLLLLWLLPLLLRIRMRAAGACKEAIASQCQDVELGDSQVADCLSQVAQAAEFEGDASERGLQDRARAAE